MVFIADETVVEDWKLDLISQSKLNTEEKDLKSTAVGNNEN